MTSTLGVQLGIHFLLTFVVVALASFVGNLAGNSLFWGFRSRKPAPGPPGRQLSVVGGANGKILLKAVTTEALTPSVGLWQDRQIDVATIRRLMLPQS